MYDHSFSWYNFGNNSTEVDSFFVKNTEINNQDSLNFIINRKGLFVEGRLFLVWFTSEYLCC